MQRAREALLGSNLLPLMQSRHAQGLFARASFVEVSDYRMQAGDRVAKRRLGKAIEMAKGRHAQETYARI